MNKIVQALLIEKVAGKLNSRVQYGKTVGRKIREITNKRPDSFKKIDKQNLAKNVGKTVIRNSGIKEQL